MAASNSRLTSSMTWVDIDFKVMSHPVVQACAGVGSGTILALQHRTYSVDLPERDYLHQFRGRNRCSVAQNGLCRHRFQQLPVRFSHSLPTVSSSERHFFLRFASVRSLVFVPGQLFRPLASDYLCSNDILPLHFQQNVGPPVQLLLSAWFLRSSFR